MVRKRERSMKIVSFSGWKQRGILKKSLEFKGRIHGIFYVF